MIKIPRHRPRPVRPPRRRLRPWRWLAAAPLAACLTAACAPAAVTSGTAAPTATAPLNCAKPGQRPCYSPQEYQVAYGVAPLLRQGINGRGETVAIFALAQTLSDHSTTDIRKDLAAFDTRFGLPQARLHAVSAIAGSPAPYLSNVEELGDTEMVHAFAPGATLDIILVPANAISSFANFASVRARAGRQPQQVLAVRTAEEVTQLDQLTARLVLDQAEQVRAGGRQRTSYSLSPSSSTAGSRGRLAGSRAGPPWRRIRSC